MKVTRSKVAAAAQKRRIVFEQTKRGYELTTPDGHCTAECGSLDECLDVIQNDATFSSLPVLPIQFKPTIVFIGLKSNTGRVSHFSVCPGEKFLTVGGGLIHRERVQPQTEQDRLALIEWLQNLKIS